MLVKKKMIAITPLTSMVTSLGRCYIRLSLLLVRLQSGLQGFTRGSEGLAGSAVTGVKPLVRDCSLRVYRGKTGPAQCLILIRK
jgi:hypothetical protein